MLNSWTHHQLLCSSYVLVFILLCVFFLFFLFLCSVIQKTKFECFHKNGSHILTLLQSVAKHKKLHLGEMWWITYIMANSQLPTEHHNRSPSPLSYHLLQFVTTHSIPLTHQLTALGPHWRESDGLWAQLCVPNWMAHTRLWNIHFHIKADKEILSQTRDSLRYHHWRKLIVTRSVAACDSFWIG